MKKIIAMILGVLMVIGSIGFLIWSFVSTQDYEKTTATVISIEYDPTVIQDNDSITEDYKVTMEYTVNGQKYTTEFNTNEGAYTVGQQVELNFDPQNPNSTTYGEMSLPVLIVICAVIALIGAVIVLKSIL